MVRPPGRLVGPLTANTRPRWSDFQRTIVRCAQSTAVRYLLDDDGELRLSLSGARKKLRNLQADPHATLFILDTTNPFRFIEVRGTVSVTADVDYSFRSKVGAHYGADVASFDAPGTLRYTITLHPERVNAQ